MLPAANPFNQSTFFADPFFKNPYSEQWNFGVQRQFGQDTAVTVNYVGSESHRLDVGGYYNTALTPGPGTPQTRAPFTYIRATNYDRSIGNGNYNALQVQVARRFASGLAYQVAYTFAKSIDTASSGSFGVEGQSLEDPYNVRASRSVSAFNVPHLISVNLNYLLPIGKGRLVTTHNRIADAVIGGWQANSIFQARSGQNFNITASGDIANTGNTGYERANLVGDPNLPHPSSQKWFNTAAFTAPANFTYGNLGRNVLRSQAYWNLDFSIFRRFPVRESMRFEFRGEAFNILNTVIYGIPNADVTNVAFGRVGGTANQPRVLQLGAKFIF